jgi:hypothetical protein
MKSTNLRAQIITVGKSVLGARLDGISRQLGNRISPMGEKPSLMQFCPLRRGPNGLMARFSDHKCHSNHSGCRSNGYTISNGYIASPWRSAMCALY